MGHGCEEMFSSKPEHEEGFVCYLLLGRTRRRDMGRVWLSNYCEYVRVLFVCTNLCWKKAFIVFVGGGAMTNTALLVIDMQNDFIKEGSVLEVKGGKSIVPNVIRAVELARQRGILVIWVVREHDPQGRDVELFRRHLYNSEEVGPTVKGTVGAELVEGLMIREKEDYKIVKTRFSAFSCTHLHSVLQMCAVSKLVIAGVQTPNCIRQTVFDAVQLDYPNVTVISDATAAATPEIHTANILDMKNIGVKTPTLQEWSKEFA